MDNDLLDKFVDFLNEFYRDELVHAVNEGNKSMSIDFTLLEKFDVGIADYLLEKPVETLEIIEKAVKQIDVGQLDPNFRIRFHTLPEHRNIRIRNVRAEHIGKFIVIDGFVKRASEVRPEVHEAVFQCLDCGSNITIIQTERLMKAPIECENPACRNRKTFKLVDQKLYDARWVVVEEPFEITSGERPSDLRIYLKEDLTTPKLQNKTEPGNRIKISGILKELPRRVKGTASRQMEIYLEANHVESVETEWEELEITPEDEQRILDLARDPEVYTKLMNSIAPGLYGLEEIKEAIVLQLFSGETHVQKDRSRVRGDMHILLVGDPATSKSSLMKVVSSLIPRGRYVSGKGVTGAGLTATVVKDEEFLGGWVLEAGALVMTNRSLCAIDEFEKIEKTDQVALHEMMEQQTISIAKANIVATLPAMTSILAGGNPKLGRFDPYLPIKEQIDIPETILSRFDLKFALRDVPNVETDTKIAEHILQSRHFGVEQAAPVVDNDMFKKYVAYARKNCHPRLSREAADELKNFYLSLRERSGEDSPISITPRQYEALIRMAESSAKIRLSEDVTPEDALRGINLMKASLRQFGLDIETGKIDIDRAEGATATAAQRSRIRIVLDVIDQLEKTFGKDIPSDELVRTARLQGVDNPDDILKKMQQEGMLFSSKVGFLSKV